MSSVFGHSLMAVTIYLVTETIAKPRSFLDRSKSLLAKSNNVFWLLWLIIVASIPDLDYAIEVWQSTNNRGLRITHSISFSLVVPILTIAVLFLIEIRGENLLLRSWQLVLAGLSHLVLDLLVGVTPLALLFPLIRISFKLPFGILPSAGKIDLDNYYFYRNLKLEMGVLLPVFSLALLWISYQNKQTNSTIKNLSIIFVSTLLLLCCVYFIHLNLALPR